MTVRTPTEFEAGSDRDVVLSQIQDRVLWLSMQMVHYANNVRENPDGLKVGGHQASSSSVVTVMTSLYFDFMRAGDRISVKPHASPIFHAIQYLLGNLDREHLKTLRDLNGLQAYPSRAKDPDWPDFTTGSVGLGAVAPNFAALVDEYARTHFNSDQGSVPRYISLVGDAELDEGSVWEAIAEPAVNDLGNVLWVVDLNRQSLDRIIPGIRVKVWREMLAANGWRIIDAKYGKRLQAAFAEPNGELLRTAIDEMPNEVYQRLLRVEPATLREWLPRTSEYPEDMRRFIGRWDDQELQSLFRNLGGHDFAMLREAFGQADVQQGPNVVFAYTLKGWMLPSVGDPQNHNATLSHDQMEQFRQQMGIPETEIWAGIDPQNPAGKLCQETGSMLGRVIEPRPIPLELTIPSDSGHTYRGNMSTQQIFGLVLTDISRNVPELSERIVTVSPDVASSTNLGGWINKVGVWSRSETEPLPEEAGARSLTWKEFPQGQHIELGISENNLFMMLGQLGQSFEATGEMLFPIGALYDPFIRRGLDALFYSLYSGGKFMVVGTPSGITLAPEGGMHQSVVTPSIGIGLPGLMYYEPCFGQELEWIMLAALERIRLRRESAYLRLTSMRVDQSLFETPSDPEARERLRQQVLAGAYRLIDRRGDTDYTPGENVVHILSSGAMVPEAVEASNRLREEGVAANVVNVTGAGPLFRRYHVLVRSAMHARPRLSDFMSDVIPPEDRAAPVVTVVDGHPQTLAWVGGALNTSTLPLGVTGFGQSGTPSQLYGAYEMDVDSIMAACFGALDI